jgi:hypothetical protein
MKIEGHIFEQVSGLVTLVGVGRGPFIFGFSIKRTKEFLLFNLNG